LKIGKSIEGLQQFVRRGPMVLDVPPATDKTVFFGSAIESWQVPLADIGGTGDDAGKGGKYVFLPPDFTGTPPEGYYTFQPVTLHVTAEHDLAQFTPRAGRVFLK
jgi:hypothetical protein